MIKNDKYICGTIEECVRELVSRIDWGKMVFPDFDFCSDPYEGLTGRDLAEAEDGCNLGECWYGCRNVAYVFGSQREQFTLLFGHWGGWGAEMINFVYEEYSEREMIIDGICKKICDVADLKRDWETVFEIVGGRDKKGERT